MMDKMFYSYNPVVVYFQSKVLLCLFSVVWLPELRKKQISMIVKMINLIVVNVLLLCLIFDFLPKFVICNFHTGKNRENYKLEIL